MKVIKLSGLILCALGNICSAEMARDLAPKIERLLLSRDLNVKKKAVLCSIGIIRKLTGSVDDFLELGSFSVEGKIIRES